jgi:predicted dithiol-disulfide oxidoreductase (DUF899 family)
MTASSIPHPRIVSLDQWLGERKQLLAHEKELTKHYDRVNAERRRLPMVKIEKEYFFEGVNGKLRLRDLFGGRRQLIIYHFMFDPTWDKGCSGWTGFIDALGNLSLLDKRDTTFVVVSRAPLAKIDAYKAEKGWNIAWFSSFGSEFNYDFHVTLDPKVTPVEYNYRTKIEMEAAVGHSVQMEGEEHGLSVFFRLEDEIFHTYSVYARGNESLTDTYRLLDTTPYGRQQILRTRLPAGLRSLLTDRPRQLFNGVQTFSLSECSCVLKTLVAFPSAFDQIGGLSNGVLPQRRAHKP